MENKARNGGTISRAPLGYKNIRAEFDGRLVNTVGSGRGSCSADQAGF